MKRIVPALVVLTAALPVLAGVGAPGAFFREARPELEHDFVGLIGEADRLSSDQRHFLPPLSELEIDNLFREDDEKPGVPKIGIVRNLTAPVVLSRSRLSRAQKTVQSPGGRLSIRPDGTAVWTTSVASPGAESIRLRFDRIDLPDGARVYVYGNGEERYGPYTREFVTAVTKGVHPFWTHTIQGGVVNVELQLDDPAADVRITIDGVGHFESAAVEEFVAQPEGTECFVDVSCATDDAALMTALSTATAQLRYRAGSSFYVCTGTLVNVSSTPDFEPYMLTANHCFDTQASASSLEAWWDYRTTECDGTTPGKTTLPKVVGAELLASDPASDFTFVRLSSNPAGSPFADGGRYYLGWSTEGPAVETTLYRASHPNGGPQVWSRTIVVDPRNQTCDSLPATRFVYSAGSYGGTTRGSSGASATNANGQIVGQNYGKCGTELTDPCNYAGANTVDGSFATTYPFVQTWIKPAVETSPCAIDDGTICLQGGRFEVKLSAIDPRTGNSDNGYVMASTDLFGYYAFPVIASNQTDPQIFVKILDGRTINGKWWVFYASLTDVEFLLTVRDTLTGATKSYRQKPYEQESKNDTVAFED